MSCGSFINFLQPWIWDYKSPTTVKSQSCFLQFYNPLVFRLPIAFESLEKPPGRATEQLLARVDFAKSIWQSIASTEQARKPLKLFWIYTQDQIHRLFGLNETWEITQPGTFILHMKKLRLRAGIYLVWCHPLMTELQNNSYPQINKLGLKKTQCISLCTFIMIKCIAV